MAAFTSVSKATISTDPSLITNALLPAGTGINFDFSTSSLTGGPSSIGFYDSSLAALGIGVGLILTSGTMPGTANTVDYYGVSNNMAGDTMLNTVVNTVFSAVSYDATILSVDFTVTDPTITSLSLNVVFGSDEFPEWVNQFVDIAAVWVNGVDYAYFNNDPTAPLSIIGSNLAANYFIDNTANLTTPSFGGIARPGAISTLPIEYDGVSAPLTIVAPIHQGVNTLRIAIADTSDHIYDSGIIISGLQGGNLPVTGITRHVDGTETNDELQGTETPETMNGKSGDDNISGAGGNDVILAGIGDDFITGGAGDDYIDGGDGSDTAIYQGSSAAYIITANADGSRSITSASDGTDTLVNVETIQFTDVTLDLATMQVIDPVAPPVGTVPTPPVQPPSTPATLPATLEPVQLLVVEDGEISEVDAFASFVGEDTGLSVVNLPATLPAGVTYNAAVHGFFVDPGNMAFQPLAGGETKTITIDYGVSNGTDVVMTSAIITVTGANDAPTVSGPVQGAATEDAATVTLNALAYASDIDAGTVLSVVGAPTAVSPTTPPTAPHGKGDSPEDATATTATPASFGLVALPAGVAFDATTNQFSIDPTNAAYQSLSAGQTTTVAVQFGVSDGSVVTPTKAVFTVTGINDVPVVTGAATAIAHEDGGSAILDRTALLANVHDPDLGDALDIQIDNSKLPAGVTYHHVPGSTTVSTVSYYGFTQIITIPTVDTLTLDTADAAYQALAEGGTQDVVVEYGVSDGTVTVPAQALFHLIGSNDAPVVSGPIAASATERGAATTVSALSNASDIDRGAVLSVAALPPANMETENFINAAGIAEGAPPPPPVLPFDPATLPAGVTFDAATNSFTLDPSASAYQSLAVGQATNVTVNYGVTDGTLITPASIVFTVTGVNDAPVVTGAATATAYEGGAGAILNQSALLANVRDPDLGDTLDIQIDNSKLPAGVAYHHVPGSTTVSTVSYYGFTQIITIPTVDTLTLDTADAAYQALAKGETQDVVVEYGVSDGTVTVPAQAIFHLIGTNDAPIVTAPVTGVAIERGDAVTLNALTHAADIDHNTTLFVSAPPPPAPEAVENFINAAGVAEGAPPPPPPVLPFDPAALPAGVTFNALTNQFTLDPTNAAYQSLAAGQITTVTVNYGVSDGIAATPATAVFTVVGINEAPIVTAPQSFATQEDAASFIVNPLANASDPNLADILRVVGDLPPAWIQRSLANVYSVNPHAAMFQSLAAGETLSVTWNYGISDGTVAVPTSLSLIVTGTNDAPVVPPLYAMAYEDTAPLSLKLLSSATDVDHGASLSLVSVQALLPAGVTFDTATQTLTINPTDPTFQALGQGQTAALSIAFAVTDGIATTPSSATFTVIGVNDAPVISAPMTATANEDGAVSSLNPASNATDVDTESKFLLATDLPSVLPAGVTFDAAVQKFYLDPTSTAYQYLSLGETADIVIPYSITDGYAKAATTGTYTISGRNDAPVIAGTVEGGSATESGTPVSINLLGRASDVDHLDTLSVATGKGNAVTASVTSGNWSTPIAFSVAGNQLMLDPTQFDALSAGESVDLTFAYTITDGNPNGSTAATAHLKITGENDAPTSLKLSVTHVTEDTPGGSVVGALSVVDPDRADAYTYQVTGDASRYFAVSGNNLVVAAGAAIDFETVASDAITVSATAADGTTISTGFAMAIDNLAGVTLNGSGGNDVYTPTSTTATTIEEDTVNGNNGDDTIDGGAGSDTLNGGAGNDTILGGTGNDTIDAGAGDDTIILRGNQSQGDTIFAGTTEETKGDTALVQGSGSVVFANFSATTASIENWVGNNQGLIGTGAGDTIDVGALKAVSGMPFIDGGSGDDTITGTMFNDDLRGNAGNEALNGGAGDDTLTGGVGADILNGGDGNNRFIEAGSDGTADVLTGGAGIDTLVMSASGPVTLTGFNATAASIEVIEGNNRGIVGIAGNETFDLSGINLLSGSGMGFLDAGSGNDIIVGTGFADDLRGGAGTDTITGGAGNDTLTGGADAETFWFDIGFGTDIINDFTAGTATGHDVLNVSTSLFANFNALKAASSQVRPVVVIAAGGVNTITLKNVTLANLVAADTLFH